MPDSKFKPEWLIGGKIILELGGGPNKKLDRINIDLVEAEGVDFVFDLENGLPFLPNNSIDEIHSSSFFEHISRFEFLMEEIYRVLKPGGNLFVFVPHFSNPYFYSDPTHKRFFGLYTFSYFSKSHFPYRRKVPKFYNSCDFRIKKQKIIFHSKTLEKIFNSRFRLQEIYEKYLSSFLPCYGLELTLEANKNEL